MAQRRAGWYFWYPFLMGGFMLAMGVGFAMAAAGSGVGGLWIGAIVEIVIGVGILFWAFSARRDIERPEPADEIPGLQPEAVTTELQATGLPGQATIKSFGFVAGSTKNGTTLVNLELDVTTARGGPVSLTHQDRVPLDLSQTLRKGIVLPCRVSSTDPSKILLDWQRVTAPT